MQNPTKKLKLEENHSGQSERLHFSSSGKFTREHHREMFSQTF